MLTEGKAGGRKQIGTAELAQKNFEGPEVEVRAQMEQTELKTI